MLPVKTSFPFTLFSISSISNFSSESGVLMFLLSFEKGNAVTIFLLPLFLVLNFHIV